MFCSFYGRFLWWKSKTKVISPRDKLKYLLKPDAFPSAAHWKVGNKAGLSSSSRSRYRCNKVQKSRELSVQRDRWCVSQKWPTNSTPWFGQSFNQSINIFSA